MLVSFNQFTKEQLISNKAEINLTAEMKNGKIRGTAYMGCQEMALEMQFANGFEKMTQYKIDGHFLTLSDKKGNTMKFIAADWD